MALVNPPAPIYYLQKHGAELGGGVTFGGVERASAAFGHGVHRGLCIIRCITFWEERKKAWRLKEHREAQMGGKVEEAPRKQGKKNAYIDYPIGVRISQLKSSSSVYGYPYPQAVIRPPFIRALPLLHPPLPLHPTITPSHLPQAFVVEPQRLFGCSRQKRVRYLDGAALQQGPVHRAAVIVHLG